jgi:hypothetical protein
MNALRAVVYDAGMVIAMERANIKAWRAHRSYLMAGGIPTVPAPVVAQVWRGSARQAQVAKALKGCHVVPLDEEMARGVGRLLGEAGTEDTVDGAVALVAAGLGAAVVTSDPDDIQHLLDQLGDRGKRVPVRPI